MCVYMCVRMYVCAQMCMYMCTHLFICAARTCICMHVHMCVCVHVCVGPTKTAFFLIYLNLLQVSEKAGREDLTEEREHYRGVKGLQEQTRKCVVL